MAAELAGLRQMLRSPRVFPDEMPGFDPPLVTRPGNHTGPH